MSLYEIPTKKGSAFVDPSVVTFVLDVEINAEVPIRGVYLYERGVSDMRFVETEKTAAEVVALLEAASSVKAPGREEVLIIDDTGTVRSRKAILIAGLRRIAHRHLDDWLGTLTPAAFAQDVLRDAGVADAEPEQESKT